MHDKDSYGEPQNLEKALHEEYSSREPQNLEKALHDKDLSGEPQMIKIGGKKAMDLEYMALMKS
jgi:hypothetical protein